MITHDEDLARLKCFATVEQVLNDFRQGRFVIVLDDEDRENEGDLVIAADKITPEAINFMATYGRGLICLPMAKELIDRLQLPMMVKENTSKQGTAFTVSIGARQGISTGISAHDRAHTIKTAINPSTSASDLSYPGHVFPLRAMPDGVLSRPGHTEASVDLARLSGLTPAAVLCEIFNKDGSLARREDLIQFAEQHGLSIISVNDLIAYRIHHETWIHESASALLPLKSYGNFLIKTYEDRLNKVQHIALISGDIPENQPCLVRIHSQCTTGDIFGSSRCDCGSQLEYSLQKIAKKGGVLLYMNQEGRGIGLANKIKAYALQDQGMDTVEANHKLGFLDDQRDYGIGAQILRQLGIKKILLLTNNPKKITGIQRYGIEVVARETIEMEPNANNLRYLRTKREKLGHLLSLVG